VYFNWEQGVKTSSFKYIELNSAPRNSKQKYPRITHRKIVLMFENSAPSTVKGFCSAKFKAFANDTSWFNLPATIFSLKLNK
jgi:hypothetical protein